MLTGNKGNDSVLHQSCVHGPTAGCAFLNPRLVWRWCKQLESGVWQAACPFKEAKEEKGALSETKKRVGEKEWVWESVKVQGWLQVYSGRSQQRHIMPESRNSVWYLQGITNCFTEILHSPGSLVGKMFHYPLESSSVATAEGLDSLVSCSLKGKGRNPWRLHPKCPDLPRTPVHESTITYIPWV